MDFTYQLNYEDIMAKNYYRVYRSMGLCCECQEPVGDGQSRCLRCRKKEVERQRVRRLRSVGVDDSTISPKALSQMLFTAAFVDILDCGRMHREHGVNIGQYINREE